MKSVSKIVAKIAANLSQHIPPPRIRESPKSQDSWASLKVGDTLIRLTDEGYANDKARHCGVRHVSSAGAILTASEGDDVMLVDREWKLVWRKLTKREVKASDR